MTVNDPLYTVQIKHKLVSSSIRVRWTPYPSADDEGASNTEIEVEGLGRRQCRAANLHEAIENALGFAFTTGVRDT